MKPLCVISGGTSGIGLEIAKNLATRYRLALIYRSQHERARAALEMLSSLAPGDQALFHGNLAVPSEAGTIVSEIEKWDARAPLVLINGAGIAANSFFTTDPLDFQLKMVQDNLVSCMVLTHFLVKKMFSNRAGHIINVSSISAENVFPAYTSYALAKAGVEAFTKNLSGELYKAGIRVNCIRPGLIRTPRTERAIDASERLKEILVPVEAAVSAVDFLLDVRSDGITGTIVKVGREYNGRRS